MRKMSYEFKEHDDLMWLRNADEKTLDDFMDDESNTDHSVYKLIIQFSKDSTGSESVLAELFDIFVDLVGKGGTELLIQTFRKDNVSVYEQEATNAYIAVNKSKTRFLVYFWSKLIELATHDITRTGKNVWSNCVNRLTDLFLRAMLFVLKQFDSCKSPAQQSVVNPTEIVLYFKIKDFLANVAMYVWSAMIEKQIQFDPERFIPVMRRLAMLDIFDPDWNQVGDWGKVLLDFENSLGATIARNPTDLRLAEKTAQLRKARNSFACQRMTSLSGRFLPVSCQMPEASQRWHYFPKCSAPLCDDIETKEKRHPFRCNLCWYYHYCSQGCKIYCETITSLHRNHCSKTTKEKAAICKGMTESYFDTTERCNAQRCNSCGINAYLCQKTLGQGLSRCSKCRKVFYCSRQCQEWDWNDGKHGEVCKRAK